MKLMVKIAITCLGIRQLVAVRVSNNASVLKPYRLAAASTLIYWHKKEPQYTMTYESAPEHISLSKLVGKHWLGIQCIQFLHGSSNDVIMDTDAADHPPARHVEEQAGDPDTQGGELPPIAEGSDDGDEASFA